MARSRIAKIEQTKKDKKISKNKTKFFKAEDVKRIAWSVKTFLSLFYLH
ncbi:TPA: hypothetical protein IX770_003240 [Enterococcus faecium]|nr:hypothetical protein [Enterococcus faecium]HAQ6432183.1 hypothetical protein [Enterococcus faecium]HAQ7829551.1 hypothetical protein [Enterococcus faecium]HAQ7830857.1 hypothetical protein [Enterococcus faecium]